LKIYSITMVKNEADIIESFVRYHLNIFDGMVILDINSSDETVSIIEKLVKEGLPVYFHGSTSNNDINRLLNYVTDQFDPDLIVPLDPDEFLTTEGSTGDIRSFLELLDPEVVYYIKWRTYIPKELKRGERFIPSRFTYARADDFEVFHKMIMGAKAVQRYNLRIQMGNHEVTAQAGNTNEFKKVTLPELRVAHYPLRSTEQLKSKVSVGWINNLSRQTRKYGEAYHWKKLYDRIKDGNEDLTESDLVEAALEYGCDRADIYTELKEFNVSFTPIIELKYTTENADTNSYRNLLDNSENMAKEFSALKSEFYTSKGTVNKRDITSIITSIVILTHNKLELTQGCISSIRKFTRPGSYEIIVVDNYSTDGTREWLEVQSDIKIILNDENLGFPKGCNQGMMAASGDAILLLNNDTLVTENWLDLLLSCLYSSEDIGAVGPVTNNATYYQAIPANYQGLDGLLKFASEYNRPDPEQWEQRIKLVGFCMLIKKKVVNEIGLLDERFTPGNYEDDDYSFRMVQAGYKLYLCKNVYIHHFGSASFREAPEEYIRLLNRNEQKFEEKWGFNSKYSTFIRNELIQLMDQHDPSEKINVLEVGCACGGTLLGIKNIFKNARLFGVELNSHSAAIASSFANVRVGDIIEQSSYPQNFFDYIILADVLEHMIDPWVVLDALKSHLKPAGKILASIPNVMHISVIKDLCRGKWTYTDAGILDRTHMRFFTMQEIKNLFESTGYRQEQIMSTTVPLSEEDELWIQGLSQLSGVGFSNQYRAYQYLLKASKDSAQEMSMIINQLDQGIEDRLEVILDQVKSGILKENDLIHHVYTNSSNKQTLLNYLAVQLYQQGIYDFVIPLLHASLELDSSHRDTLFNMGQFLYLAGESQVAATFLNAIDNKDEEVLDLLRLTSV
jgi:O-antigen biosynthesis protein